MSSLLTIRRFGGGISRRGKVVAHGPGHVTIEVLSNVGRGAVHGLMIKSQTNCHENTNECESVTKRHRIPYQVESSNKSE
jgi:hypothetical protein